MEESEVLDKAFDLIFAFDEIVALGYRESVNLAQIRTFVEMDSHEEKVYRAVRETQEREARTKMKVGSTRDSSLITDFLRVYSSRYLYTDFYLIISNFKTFGCSRSLMGMELFMICSYFFLQEKAKELQRKRCEEMKRGSKTQGYSGGSSGGFGVSGGFGGNSGSNFTAPTETITACTQVCQVKKVKQLTAVSYFSNECRD